MNMHRDKTVNANSWLAVVFIAALLVYARTLTMGFVYDDFSVILENRIITDIKNIPFIFGSDGWRDLGKHSPYYRPISTLTLLVDFSFWRYNPLGYHLFNVLLHATNALLVAFILRRLTMSLAAAIWGGLFFALHPIQAEAVSWIAARCDMVCAIFLLASFYCFDRASDNSQKAFRMAAPPLFFFALLSKEMAITFPFILLIYDYSRTRDLKTTFVRMLPFAAAVACYFGLRLAFLDMQVWGNHPFSWRLFTSFGLVAGYLKNTIIPFDLRVFYDLPIQKVFLAPSVLVPLAILSCVMLLLVGGWQRYRKESAAIACGLIMLLPVSGILTLLNPSLMADRYMYIPMAGFAAAFGFAMSRAIDESRSILHRQAANITGAAILLIFSFLSFSRSHDWQDQQAFMRSVVRDAPSSEFGHFFRANLAKDEGRHDEAIREYFVALAINPTLAEAHFNLGVIYQTQGAAEKAEQSFLKVLASDQGHVKTYNNLGVLYATHGRLQEALATFEKGLKAVPDDIKLHDNILITRNLLNKQREPRQR